HVGVGGVLDQPLPGRHMAGQLGGSGGLDNPVRAVCRRREIGSYGEVGHFLRPCRNRWHRPESQAAPGLGRTLAKPWRPGRGCRPMSVFRQAVTVRPSLAPPCRKKPAIKGAARAAGTSHRLVTTAHFSHSQSDRSWITASNGVLRCPHPSFPPRLMHNCASACPITRRSTAWPGCSPPSTACCRSSACTSCWLG